MSLCDSDSDLFIQNYNAIHRKSSDSSHSAAISYYSGTESQQSVSDRSFYDNIAVDAFDRHYTKAKNYLMPPMIPLRSAHVNRSVSFQDAVGQSRKFLTPRGNVIKRTTTNSSSIQDIDSNRSSASPNDCISIKTDVQNCSYNKRIDENGPFYLRILRRMQKLSTFWRKRKRAHRGRLIVFSWLNLACPIFLKVDMFFIHFCFSLLALKY
jgi:hypothetical protein